METWELTYYVKRTQRARFNPKYITDPENIKHRLADYASEYQDNSGEIYRQAMKGEVKKIDG